MKSILVLVSLLEVITVLSAGDDEESKEKIRTTNEPLTTPAYSNYTEPIVTTTTSTTKSRRKRTKVRRSPTTTTATTTTRTIKTKQPSFSGVGNWLYFMYKFRRFFCMKQTECQNDMLYFERRPKGACARNFLTAEMVWFDHKCSVWVMNCRGKGLYFTKHTSYCVFFNAKRIIDEDYLDPPRTIRVNFKQNR